MQLKNITKTISIKLIFIVIISAWSFSSDGMDSHQTAELCLSKMDLGFDSDFSRNNQIFLPEQFSWGDSGSSDNIRFRRLKPSVSANIFIKSFNTDANGFCRKDVILEINYRDDIKQKEETKYKFSNRATVESRIDNIYENEYVLAGVFECLGDGKWKTAKIFFEKTPFQLIRAIDGAFRFKIVVPGKVSLPVSSITLAEYDRQTFISFRENDRILRGFERVEYPDKQNLAGSQESGNQINGKLDVFFADCLELVYPHSNPLGYLSGDRLELFEVAGHKESGVFVINSSENIEQLSISVSDLFNQKTTQIISNSNISLKKIVYNDQRWGWERANKYGTCPDYLVKLKLPIDIKNDLNYQIWVTVNVPQETVAGTYEGTITLASNDEKLKEIQLSLAVSSVKLQNMSTCHMVYHSPFFKQFDTDRKKVLYDMYEHGLLPIVYPQGEVFINRQNEVGFITDKFRDELKEIRKIYQSEKVIFVGLNNYYLVWAKLSGHEPKFYSNFPEFNIKYGKLLKQYALVAAEFGFELVFSFIDEPNANPDSRRIAYLCSMIARSNGLKIWSAYLPSTDVQLALSEQDKLAGINYLRPLSEELDFLVSGIWAIDDNTINKYKSKPVNISYYTTFAATSIRPVYNRLLHGIYPHITGSSYVVSYAYRDNIGDPYDDLDYRPQESVLGLNDFLLTYPSWNGDILPTLSYEAIREGIEDFNLIKTLKYEIDKCFKSENYRIKKIAEEAESYLSEILNRISRDFKNAYWSKHKDLPIDPMEKAILRDLNNDKSEGYEIFNKIRWDICQYIIKLQNLEDSNETSITEFKEW